MIPEAVQAWAVVEGRGEVTGEETVGGGCINHTTRLRFADGSSAFLKLNPQAPAELFAAEATGLRALAIPGAPRVPTVLLEGRHHLLLEDLPPGPRAPDYWERFGRELAALHAAQAETFGFECDTWCGDTLQPNPEEDDGHAFYAEHRFGFQARLALQRGRIEAGDLGPIERFIERLPELVPQQAPALLHGDLWSGNAHVTSDGAPALIDPACYRGWPEAELAMTCLFGGFGEAFYRAYEEAGEIARDWRDRVDLHNVYHLLNHANIFGGGYAEQALAIVRRYA